ncbi:helix-turn-helix protein [Streptomyces sp. CEV 2-1]|uniref:helix-turn-helix domain-containing protein n=1 Tax=unclassified Streptomyces TaxID=2593676 RepID=UPI000F48829E|nr:XRE family transcriptional regulator [Streptomyces sp. CEV 2-1]ROQ82248.1 helix-turn-helix protein [Streptomyces sp. CEV 2-1]
MPRWKALPEDLDPQVREFAGQLRRLVDRSGLSIAAVADRTGYSKTSWERYLNGRLLAPRGAIVALAEVTGTNHVHLNTMWELTERAWSRAEMRHDMTMEGMRIIQARAALGETGQPSRGHGRSRPSHGVGTAEGGTGAAPGVSDGGRSPSVPAQRGSVPQVPQQPQVRPDRAMGAGPGVPPAMNAHGGAPGQPPAHRGSGSGKGSGSGRGRGGGSRKQLVIAAAAVGVLLAVTGVVLLTGSGGDSDADKAAAPSPSPTASAPELPAGVGCSGSDCAGQDPEDMGCGGEYVRTVSSATVGGSVVEVRYSKTCGAAWARITKAATGDTVRISAGGAGQDGTVSAAADTYTPMVAVKRVADVKACATLATGTKGCTAEATG